MLQEHFIVDILQCVTKSITNSNELSIELNCCLQYWVYCFFLLQMFLRKRTLLFWCKISEDWEFLASRVTRLLLLPLLLLRIRQSALTKSRCNLGMCVVWSKIGMGVSRAFLLLVLCTWNQPTHPFHILFLRQKWNPLCVWVRLIFVFKTLTSHTLSPMTFILHNIVTMNLIISYHHYLILGDNTVPFVAFVPPIRQSPNNYHLQLSLIEVSNIQYTCLLGRD